MSDATKRCAKCGREYAADYDGCPSCARPVLRFFRGYVKFNQIALAAGVVMVLAFTLWFSVR